MKVFIFLALLFRTCYPTAALAQPQRIVSMNVCSDQLLLLLVEPERIASLSYLASDASYSNLATQAAAIPKNRGQADAIVQLEPDLVVTGPFSATFAASLLQRLHFHVEQLPVANSIAQLYQQLQSMGAWTQTQAVASDKIRGTETAIAAWQQQLQPLLQAKSAVFISSNGIAFGSNTLQHDFMQSLGLRNVAAELGLEGPAVLPLEQLLVAKPDYVITELRGALDKQLAHPFLQHRALQQLPIKTINLRDRWFDCPGPWLAEAYAALAAQMSEP